MREGRAAAASAQTETKKADALKSSTQKAAAPKTEAKKPEPPKSEPLTAGALETEAKKAEATKTDAKKGDLRRVEDATTKQAAPTRQEPAAITEGPAEAQAGRPLLRITVDNAAYVRLLDASNPAGAAVRSLAFSPNGRLLAWGADDKKVYLAQVARAGGLLQNVRTWAECDDEVRTVAFSPDGKVLAAGSGDRCVRLWSTTTGKLLLKIDGYEQLKYSDHSLFFSPDGKTLAVANGRDVSLVKVDDGAVIGTINVGSYVYSMALSSDASLLAVGTPDDARLFRVADKTLLYQMRTGARLMTIMRSVSFSSDGSLLAAGATTHHVYVFQVADGKLRTRLTGHGNDVNRVVFSADGALLTSVSDDQKMCLWRVSDGTCLVTLPGAARLSTVAFSPDDTLLATASTDKIVRVWGIGEDEPTPDAKPKKGGLSGLFGGRRGS